MPRQFLPAALLLAAAAMAPSWACDSSDPAGADGSVQRSYQLQILDPPGDAIGLDFSATATLRVRYLDDDAQPMVGQLVTFALLESGSESTGGASLSSTTAATDESGIARVDLVAGAERVGFRVEATAPQAPSVLFYIQVSDQGFTNLQIQSLHEGPRDPTDYERIQLRLYDGSDLSCVGLDFDAPPQSIFPPRSQSDFGSLSEFKNLAADEAYTVIAWAEVGGGRPLATGCLSLASSKLRSGSTFAANLSVRDRPFEVDAPLLLQTDVDLQPLTETLPGASTWDSLSCPLGRAQLLLDCLADAQNPDGLLDCEASGSGAFISALDLRRGELDSEGCRPALDSEAAPSIEALLDAAMVGWPSATELADLVDGYRDTVSGVVLRSQLSDPGNSVATHRLLEAQVGGFVIDLVDSARPVIESSGLALGLGAEPLLSVPSHGFTLRYGDIATDAFETLSLAPANVSGLGASLGSELISGVSISEESGCAALQSFVCSELALAASCLDLCSEVATPLDGVLAGWLPALQSSGLDYQFSFEAALADSDNDLRIDTISADETAVQAQLSTSTQTASLPATLTGAAATPN